MKKTTILLSLSMLGCVQLAHAQGTAIKKVTYFPIPYVSYYRVNADSLDVGIGRQPATGRLGQNVMGTPIQVDDETTLEAGGTLTLNKSNGTTVVNLKAQNDQDAVIGGTSSSGPSEIKFEKNLRANTGNLTTLNTSVAEVKKLELFGKLFPACDANKDSAGNNMYWVRLKLGADDGCNWYLSCGKVEESEQCTDVSSN